MAPKHDYYLKITEYNGSSSIQDIDNIIREHNEHIKGYLDRHDTSAFGSFQEIFHTDSARVIRYNTFSQEIGVINTPYVTQGKALTAAIEFFDKRGYQAKVVDLEAVVDQL
jgi:hypothetical protein